MKKMKKMLCVLLAIAAMLMLSGCEKESKTVNNAVNSASSVENTIAQQIENSTNADMPASDDAFAATEPKPQETEQDNEQVFTVSEEDTVAVDVDLTKFSGTMLYSEVYNMMCAPEDYLGKIVKMRGAFNTFGAIDANGEPVPDAMYYACVIADATACCQQGLEFILAGDYKYPEDYPKLNSQITVVGEFQTYMEGEYRYCHLINAVLCE